MFVYRNREVTTKLKRKEELTIFPHNFFSGVLPKAGNLNRLTHRSQKRNKKLGDHLRMNGIPVLIVHSAGFLDFGKYSRSNLVAHFGNRLRRCFQERSLLEDLQVHGDGAPRKRSPKPAFRSDDRFIERRQLKCFEMNIIAYFANQDSAILCSKMKRNGPTFGRIS